MKKVLFFLSVLFTCTLFSIKTFAKDPVIVEIETNFKTLKEATMATKTALMKQKFIPTGSVTETGFQATRTTGSHADYYTADVTTVDRNGKIVVTVTLIKSGTGLLKLQKVADELKAELGYSSSTGMIQQNTNSSQVKQVAQENLSQEQMQAKCNNFTNMKKGGTALLISGIALFGTGIIFQSLNSGSNTLYNAGGIMMPLGVIAIGGGIPLKIIGSKKSKQYCKV